MSELTRRGFFGRLAAFAAGAVAFARPSVSKAEPALVTETWTVASAFCGFNRDDRAYAKQFEGRTIRVRFPSVTA